MKGRAILLGTSLALALSASGQDSTNAEGEVMRGIPGVATHQAVVNFAALARQGATPAAPPLAAHHTAPAEFTAASVSAQPPLPAPASSFLALLGDGELWDKPDTQGAVGPNHLMVALNTSVRIQDRSGEVISTVSLSNFWSALGPFNVQYFDGYPFDSIGDPKVMFDPYANRFVLVTEGNVGATNSVLLVGVSQTSDPTGRWNLYRFDVDVSHLTYHDYPFIGFNKDWIAVQGIMFTVPNNGFSRVQIYVFNKTNLYAGGNGAFTLFSRSDIGSYQTPAVTFDTNVSTLYLLQQMGEFSTSINTLRIFTITGPVGSEVFTIGPMVTATNRWNFTAPGGWNSNFSPQLGSPVKIMTKGANFYSLVYRNGSLWAAQTIYLPAGGAATRNAIQWWEISPAGSILQRGLIDDPTGTTFYDFPSLAVNQFNDVLIGYSRFSSNQYASANYSFRAGSDPPNTLRGDAVLKAGEAPRDVTLPNYPYNTWGDYSATMVDPFNDTDLWTIQEYESMPVSGGLWGGDNWGTWWGRIAPGFRIGGPEIAVTEGDTGTTNAAFVLALPYPTNVTVSAEFFTRDSSARAGVDYASTNGTVIFDAGQTNQIVLVPVFGDLIAESNRTFLLVLTNFANALEDNIPIRATILDDDNVSLAISDASVVEDNLSATNALFTVRLLQPSKFTVTLDFATTNGSAAAGLDYVATNGTLTFAPGETNQTIAVPVLGDILDETNETFAVLFSNPTNIILTDSLAVGTIVDNDPLPAISISDISVREGDTGFADATFTFSLSTPSGLPVSFRALTANSSATLRVDYMPTNIIVLIPPGASNRTHTIQIIGDTLIESNETFFLNLSSPTNATIADTRGICTILDDDFKVTAVEFMGADVRLGFTTQTNQTYRVERTDGLAPPIAWEPVPGAASIAGTGAVVQVLDPGASTRAQRFYRIRLN